MTAFNLVVLISVATVLLLSTIEAFSTYRGKIPNGYRVYHPCSPYQLIMGIGHVSSSGGGSRNDFGLAFAEAGYKWTPAVCYADSDNDGLSNGFELGDPDCLWTRGATPARKTNITSPGISNKCR